MENKNICNYYVALGKLIKLGFTELYDREGILRPVKYYLGNPAIRQPKTTSCYPTYGGRLVVKETNETVLSAKKEEK